MRVWIMALGAVLTAPGALAQSNGVPTPAPTPAQTVVISDVQAAQLLIANNRLDDAKRLLDHLLAAKPDDSELLFLRANVAVAQQDYDTAISLFRRILVREPEAERVRLELARAFFL